MTEREVTHPQLTVRQLIDELITIYNEHGDLPVFREGEGECEYGASIHGVRCEGKSVMIGCNMWGEWN